MDYRAIQVCDVPLVAVDICDRFLTVCGFFLEFYSAASYGGLLSRTARTYSLWVRFGRGTAHAWRHLRGSRSCAETAAKRNGARGGAEMASSAS